MKLNNTQIETIGVNAVEEYFNLSDTLHPCFPKDDKNPVWDGKLLLYHRGGKNYNKSLIGQIQAQIKAKCCTDTDKETIKYNVRVNDLRVYKDNCGVAYFVVYYNSTTRQKKIYYSLLAPIELRKLIEDAGKKDTLSATFNKLPDLSDTIEHEFFDFFNDCLKQQSFSRQKAIPIDDLNGSIASLRINLTCSQKNKFEAFQDITTRPVFIYATLKGDVTKTLHPVGDSRCKIALLNKDTKLPISVGNKMFYETCAIEIKDGDQFLVIGGGALRIPIFIKDEVTNTNVNVSITPHFKTLNQEITGMEFMLALNEHKSFFIGNVEVRTTNLSMDYISYAENKLVAAKRFKKVLDILHVSDEFIIENLSDNDIKNINLLSDHYLNNTYISPDGVKENKLVRMTVSNLSFLFLFIYNEKEDKYEMYSVYDWFSFDFVAKTQQNHVIKIPYFMTIEPDLYNDISNMDYSNFVHACSRLGTCNNKQIECINDYILKMLNVYDKQRKKNEKLLQAAYDVCKWLLDANEEETYQISYILNLLQIIKRQRSFTKLEEEQLYNILDSNNENQIKFAANVLLGNISAAKRYFEKFDSKLQQCYRKMPIYNFMN